MFNVNVTISLSADTLAVLSALTGTAKNSSSQETSAAPTAQQDKAEKTPKGGGAGSSKPPKEEPVKEAPATLESYMATFGLLGDDEKIEAIKTEVTKHTKRGKSGDIKALLTFVGVARVSELQGDDIDTFMALVQRYGKGGEGNSLEDLTSLD